MRASNLISAVFCIAAISCVTPDEESVDTASQSIRIANKLSANRIALNRIALNRIALNRIALNRIALNRIALNRIALNRIALNRIALNKIALNGSSADLMDSADAREVFSYVVQCALPQDTALVGADSTGTEYEFDGAIGLAPGWLDHPLNKREKRWVSACLLSRVNAHGVSVQISLRGHSPALEVGAEERANWTNEEGTFYGQVFVPDSEPMALFACSGHNLEAAHDHLRDCANPDPDHPGLTYCGFTYTGTCGEFAPHTPKACGSYSKKGTYYRNCSTTGVGASDDGDDDDDGDDSADDDGSYRQVITTFVHS